MSVGFENFLLRGSSLRNTDYAYGVVVYTGHETKIMKNSISSRQKKSHLERKINWLIFSIFLLEISFCLFAAVYSATWNSKNIHLTEVYLHWSADPSIWNEYYGLSFL